MSFASLTAFDSVWVYAEDEEGRVGLGEAVALPGYGWETADSVASTVARIIGGSESREDILRDRAACERTQNPFAASAVVAALDMPEYVTAANGGEFALNSPVSGEIPVTQFRGDVLRALDNGFEFIKVKIGIDLAANIAAARCILQEFPDRQFHVVFDANQGFSLQASLEFARALAACATRRLLWFEQPVSRTAWSDMEQVCRTALAPVVLDECIYDETDVGRAADMGAFGVKLKLFKNFGITGTLKLARKAHDAGLVVVFGNGVATDIGNLSEYLTLATAPKLFAPPIEANGFAKLKNPLLHVLGAGPGGTLFCRADSARIQTSIEQFVARAQAATGFVIAAT